MHTKEAKLQEVRCCGLRFKFSLDVTMSMK